MSDSTLQDWLRAVENDDESGFPPLAGLLKYLTTQVRSLTAKQQVELVQVALDMQRKQRKPSPDHKVAIGTLAALHVAQKRVMLENLNLREKLAKKKATIKALWRLLKLSTR